LLAKGQFLSEKKMKIHMKKDSKNRNQTADLKANIIVARLKFHTINSAVILVLLLFTSCVSYGFQKEYLSESSWQESSVIIRSTAEDAIFLFDQNSQSISASLADLTASISLIGDFSFYFNDLLVWIDQSPQGNQQIHLLLLGSFPNAILKAFLKDFAEESHLLIGSKAYDLYRYQDSTNQGDSDSFEIVIPRNGVLYATNGSAEGFMEHWVDFHFSDNFNSVANVNDSPALTNIQSSDKSEILVFVRSEAWNEWQNTQNISIPIEELILELDREEMDLATEALLVTNDDANIRGIRNALRILFRNWIDEGILSQNLLELRQELEFSNMENILKITGIRIKPEIILSLVLGEGELK
jgi:hypothetical protein